jgi:hypothetical protein
LRIGNDDLVGKRRVAADNIRAVFRNYDARARRGRRHDGSSYRLSTPSAGCCARCPWPSIRQSRACPQETQTTCRPLFEPAGRCLEYLSVKLSVRRNFAKCWSEWQDLNLRPPRPERGALPEVSKLASVSLVAMHRNAARALYAHQGPFDQPHQLGQPTAMSITRLPQKAWPARPGAGGRHPDFSTGATTFY